MTLPIEKQGWSPRPEMHPRQQPNYTCSSLCPQEQGELYGSRLQTPCSPARLLHAPRAARAQPQVLGLEGGLGLSQTHAYLATAIIDGSGHASKKRSLSISFFPLQGGLHGHARVPCTVAAAVQADGDLRGLQPRV